MPDDECNSISSRSARPRCRSLVKSGNHRVHIRHSRQCVQVETAMYGGSVTVGERPQKHDSKTNCTRVYCLWLCLSIFKLPAFLNLFVESMKSTCDKDREISFFVNMFFSKILRTWRFGSFLRGTVRPVLSKAHTDLIMWPMTISFCSKWCDRYPLYSSTNNLLLRKNTNTLAT